MGVLCLAVIALWIANRVLPSSRFDPRAAKSVTPPEAVLQGRVQSVVDGDTILLDQGIFVRLNGIDAPEKDQAGYDEATAALRRLVEGRIVNLEYDKGDDIADRYGRLLAFVATDSCRCVNEQLLRLGWVRIYRAGRDPERRRAHLEAQRQAMDRKAGLWASLHDSGGPYHGHSRSRIFHRPDCSFGKKISPKNRTTFEHLRDAFWEGYSPCRSCLTHPLEGR